MEQGRRTSIFPISTKKSTQNLAFIISGKNAFNAESMRYSVGEKRYVSWQGNIMDMKGAEVERDKNTNNPHSINPRRGGGDRK